MSESTRASGEFFLDTSAVIEILRNKPSIRRLFQPEDRFFVSAIVLGELYYGAYRSDNPAKEIEKINQFIQRCTVIPISEEIAKYYGWLKNLLKSTPIPENDLWIASTALVYDLTLVSNDRHFLRVPNIEIRSWE